LGSAKSAALLPHDAPAGPELEEIIQRWESLPNAVKVGITAMVRASSSFVDTTKQTK